MHVLHGREPGTKYREKHVLLFFISNCHVIQHPQHDMNACWYTDKYDISNHSTKTAGWFIKLFQLLQYNSENVMLYKNDSNQLNLVNGIVTEINKKKRNMNITQNTLCKSWTKWKTSTLKFVKQASFDLGEKDWRSDRGQQKNWQKTWSDVSEVGKIEKKWLRQG